jgi:hypothetical protein|tara:strand:- start:396 stop:551 length:156 start_codon:yes stop_codon:yes gene_type:complete
MKTKTYTTWDFGRQEITVLEISGKYYLIVSGNIYEYPTAEQAHHEAIELTS